jgi:hypothetical protein
MDGWMALMLSLLQPGEVVKRVPYPHSFPGLQSLPWRPGSFLDQQSWVKVSRWAHGEEKAEKIKGIFDEMLICFWKQVGVAATRSPRGYARLSQEQKK